MLSSKLNIFSHNSYSKWSELKNAFTSRGHFIQMIILSTYNPMLSSKLNALSLNSIPSGQNGKIHSQAGFLFSRQSFSVPTTLSYLQISMFCPITLFNIVRLEKFIHKWGSFFFRWLFWVPITYVIFKIEHFIPHFYLTQYYLLYAYRSHISYFSSAILLALNDNLEITLM